MDESLASKLISIHSLDKPRPYMEFTFETFEDYRVFIKLIGLLHAYKNRYIFRGVTSKDYGLIPSVLREATKLSYKPLFERVNPRGFRDEERTQISIERSILKSFFNLCDLNGLKIPDIPELRRSIHTRNSLKLLNDEQIDDTPGVWIPEHYLELTALAQHYGIPTRLLDWTYDENVALYFATLKMRKTPNEDGYISVWMIDYKSLANSNQFSEIPIRFIRPSYFDNPNVRAQKGVLSIWSVNEELLHRQYHVETDRRAYEDKIINYMQDGNFEANDCRCPILIKCNITMKAAKGIIAELDHNGYNSATLFPGYYGIAKYINEEIQIET